RLVRDACGGLAASREGPRRADVAGPAIRDADAGSSAAPGTAVGDSTEGAVRAVRRRGAGRNVRAEHVLTAARAALCCREAEACIAEAVAGDAGPALGEADVAVASRRASAFRYADRLGAARGLRPGAEGRRPALGALRARHEVVAGEAACKAL